MARQLGITSVIAEVLPENKAAVLRRVQSHGAVVAVIGDAVNDAAALATAELGLAMGTGTDAAIEAADLALVSGDPTAACRGDAGGAMTLSSLFVVSDSRRLRGFSPHRQDAPLPAQLATLTRPGGPAARAAARHRRPHR